MVIGQRQLKPSVHLKPFQELDNATITALAEDALGQIWIGTQTGIRFWDGNNLHKIDSISSTVSHMSAKDSCVYSVQLNSIVKINCWTLRTDQYNFSSSDYRQCNFLEDGILTISNDLKDTIFLDYDLNQKKDRDVKLSHKESVRLGTYEVFIDHRPNRNFLIGDDSSAFTDSFVNHLLKYDEKTVFAASHEGLIELQLTNSNQINKVVHLSGHRVEQLLIDHNRNFWVGTAENGLFMFHRNMILNEYYPLHLDQGAYNACWTFAELDGQVYCCTTNGLIAFQNRMDEPTELEKATEGLLCFRAKQTPEGIFIGTAKEGLYL